MSNTTVPKWAWRQWLYLMQPGDGLLLLCCIALWAWIAPLCWSQGSATRVKVFQDGQLFAELDLAAQRTLAIAGPLGDTVVEVAAGRVRIASDPSPRQYCVRAGWLSQAGQSAICLPNRTSIQLIGNQPPAYDSLTY